MKQHIKTRRHPELVSGSIVPPKPSVEEHEWILKQVQNDVQWRHKKAALFFNKAAFCM
jgi:hypothetical protein